MNWRPECLSCTLRAKLPTFMETKKSSLTYYVVSSFVAFALSGAYASSSTWPSYATWLHLGVVFVSFLLRYEGRGKKETLLFF